MMDRRTILGELAGGASMCWIPRPSTAVFDSDQASKLVDEAMQRLMELEQSEHCANREAICPPQ